MLNDYFNELKNSELGSSFDVVLDTYHSKLKDFRCLLSEELSGYKIKFNFFKEYTDKLLSIVNGLKNYSLSLDNSLVASDALFDELSSDFITSSIKMVDIISEINFFSLTVVFDSKRINNLLIDKINDSYTKLVLVKPSCFVLPGDDFEKLSKVIDEPISNVTLKYGANDFNDVYQSVRGSLSLIEATINDFVESKKGLKVDYSFSNYWSVFIKSLSDFSSCINFHKEIIDLTSSLKEFVLANNQTLKSYCRES